MNYTAHIESQSSNELIKMTLLLLQKATACLSVYNQSMWTRCMYILTGHYSLPDEKEIDIIVSTILHFKSSHVEISIQFFDIVYAFVSVLCVKMASNLSIKLITAYILYYKYVYGISNVFVLAHSSSHLGIVEPCL